MENQKRISEVTLISTGVWASLAISGGIIAIMAHNWDQLSHMVRVFLSILPVLAGLTVFSYAFLIKSNSRVWMESSSVFLMLMLGSSIGLIAQVYHMGGDFSRFLFYWMLFSIPIIYIGKSTTTAILYLFGITWWILLMWYNRFNIFAMNSSLDIDRIWYWILLLGFLPYFYLKIRDRNHSLNAIVLGYALIICFSFTFNISYITDTYFHASWMLLLVYFAGKYYYPTAPYFWLRPLQTWSILFMISFAFFYTYEGKLGHMVYDNNYLNHNGSNHWLVLDANFLTIFSVYFNHILFFIFIGLIIYLYKKLKSENRFINPMHIVFPIIMMKAMFLELMDWSIGARVLLNIYIIVYAAWYVYHGLQNQLPGIIAWALFVLTALLVVRYFDMDISFWTKGILYISIGSLALLFNKYYSEKINS